MRRLLLLLALVVGCSESERYNAPAPTDCVPMCADRSCGVDGCGGSCGDCGAGEVCSVAGTCIPACVADCSQQMCGDDGCGGSCGDCAAPTPLCDTVVGRCTDCLGDCTNRICGDDGCGGSCGTCDAPFVCAANGSCECVADCTGRECGFSCDVMCGPECDAGEICNDAGRCEVCTPSCAGRVCGDDGCGGTCGDCAAEQRCTEAGLCEACNCGVAECSADGCCGDCPVDSNGTALVCTSAGLCSCQPDCMPACDGRSCGPDGCGGTCGADCAANQRCTYDRTAATAVECRAFTASADMSFFVTSVGNTVSGGDFGGLAGADALCQRLAAEVGAGRKTWVAYLSVTGTAARDRIGMRAWRDASGAPIVDPACEAANDCVQRLHATNPLFEAVRTERGDTIDVVNAAAVFTGSDASGNATGMDCDGWTTSDEFAEGSAGSADAGSAAAQGRWNSGRVLRCDRVGAGCAAGRAHLYCFAPRG